MARAFIRTGTNRYTRCLVVEFDGAGRAEFWGDPVKVVAALLIFNNATVKSWVRNKGLEVEVAEDVITALKALSREPMTWQTAAKNGFLQDPTPQQIINALSIKAILKR